MTRRDAASLAEALGQAVFGLREGCVAWVNPAGLALAGRGAEVLGWKLRDLFEDTGCGLPRADADGSVGCALVRPGGERRDVVCRPIPVTWGDLDATWIIEDWSHVRRLERELLTTGRELAQVNRSNEELLAQLRAERTEREELLSVVSHELRTPVTVIAGYNRLLLSEEVGALEPEQRRFLEESRKSCARLDAFIGKLVDASRVDKGAHVLELGVGPLRPVIDGVHAMLRPMLEECGMTLRVSCDGATRARFDQVRIEQVLLNLVGNAIKYGGSGGSIALAVDAETRSDFVEVSVADEGPGVPPELRERVFEPYVQCGDESRGGGLGLGLAICRRLVEAHGGVIRVTDRPGGGSYFAFTLPTAGAPASPAMGGALG